jgi:hypothetical protein
MSEQKDQKGGLLVAEAEPLFFVGLCLHPKEKDWAFFLEKEA